jgi:hypothetical protein
MDGYFNFVNELINENPESELQEIPAHTYLPER